MYMKKSSKGATAEAIMLLILFVIAVVSVIYRNTRQPVFEGTETYIVQPGDTLWSIAVKYINVDPREVVYKIEKLNRIGPVIQIGQEILIPSKNVGVNHDY